MRPRPGAEPRTQGPGRTEPPSVAKLGVAPVVDRHVAADGGFVSFRAEGAVLVAFAYNSFIRALRGEGEWKLRVKAASERRVKQLSSTAPHRT